MTSTMTMYYSLMSSPLGELTLASDGEALNALLVGANPAADWVRDDTALNFAREPLEAYFRGELRQFDLKLQQQGTAFQTRVWAELMNIPYGETISYRELARRIGDDKASRAVGTANGRNNICVIVPCHRVIAADGSLGGYSGGLWRKEWLLKLESDHR